MLFLIDEIHLNESVNATLLTKDHEGWYRQNAWPEFIHYRKYKNNEKTHFKQIWAGLIKQQVDHPMVLMLEMSTQLGVGGVSIVVYDSFCLLKVYCICVCSVFLSMFVRARTNSINIKVCHMSFIKKVWSKNTEENVDNMFETGSFLEPGVYRVFYIMCLTLSNTVH